jgi:hypothetical protein
MEGDRRHRRLRLGRSPRHHAGRGRARSDDTPGPGGVRAPVGLPAVGARLHRGQYRGRGRYPVAAAHQSRRPDAARRGLLCVRPPGRAVELPAPATAPTPVTTPSAQTPGPSATSSPPSRWPGTGPPRTPTTSPTETSRHRASASVTFGGMAWNLRRYLAVCWENVGLTAMPCQGLEFDVTEVVFDGGTSPAPGSPAARSNSPATGSPTARSASCKSGPTAARSASPVIKHRMDLRQPVQQSHLRGVLSSSTTEAQGAPIVPTQRAPFA